MRFLKLAAASLILTFPTVLAATPAPRAQALLLDRSPVRAAALPERALRSSGVEGRFNSAALDAGRITLQLADGRMAVAVRQQEFVGRRGERSWLGQFEGYPGSLFSVTSYRGNVHGFMHRGAEVYEVESIGGGRVRFYRVDESFFAPEGDPMVSPATTDADTSATESAASVAEPVTQDLLVVYTPAAVSWSGGEANLQTRIVNAVAAANAGYQNSEVGIHLNLVGMAVTHYQETGSMQDALARLRSIGDGYMDDVHALRNALNADLVSLVTLDTDYCGYAYINPDATGAFSVVLPTCFSSHTLAHEIGHNQGNAHDQANAKGSPGAFAYSYGYRTCDHPELANGQSFRTVMSYSCTGERVNYFSNPRVLFNGAAQTGIDHDLDPRRAADNARSMNETAPLVAAFRGGAAAPPAAPTALAGVAVSPTRVDLTWFDNAGDESGYRLERATTGDYAVVATLPAGTTFFSHTGLEAGQSYSFRIVAYNAAGSSGYSNAVQVTTPGISPTPDAPAPASVSWDAATAMASVTWMDVSHEESYEVVRDTWHPKKGAWTSTVTMLVGADLNTLAEELSSGTYRYRVRALGSGGDSAFVAVSCAGVTGCGATAGAGTSAFTVAVGSSGRKW